MKRLLFIICIVFMVVGVVGCDVIGTVIGKVSGEFQHAQEVTTDLEKAIGKQPFVGFNADNGSLTEVNITFEGVPPGKTIEEIADLSRNAIIARFKQEPENIVISFILSGKKS